MSNSTNYTTSAPSGVITSSLEDGNNPGYYEEMRRRQIKYMEEEQKREKAREEREQEIINTPMSAFVKTLKDTVDKKGVDKLDYDAQIDRWNEYQTVLDRIDKKCRHTGREVELKRRVKHNMLTWDAGRDAPIFTALACASPILIGVGLIANNWFLTGSGLGLIGLGVRHTLLRTIHPKTLVFECKPELHFDEMITVRKMVKGFPEVQKDPVVKLPSIKMKIPRKYFAQKGMLKFMEGVQDINLPDF